jgi:hypothetical protein
MKPTTVCDWPSMNTNHQPPQQRPGDRIDIDHPRVQEAAVAIMAAEVYGNPKELNRVHARLAVAAARR